MKKDSTYNYVFNYIGENQLFGLSQMSVMTSEGPFPCIMSNGVRLACSLDERIKDEVSDILMKWLKFDDNGFYSFDEQDLKEYDIYMLRHKSMLKSYEGGTLLVLRDANNDWPTVCWFFEY